MLRTLSGKPILCTLVCWTLILSETALCSGMNPNGSVTVAFLGIKFDGVDPMVQTRIQVGVLGMLYQAQTVTILSQDQISQKVGSERLKRVLENISRDSLQALSAELGADYILTGNLKRLGDDTLHTILEGKWYRYDRSADVLRSSRVLRYAEEFDLELAQLKREFVDTIVPERAGFFAKYWPVVIAGVIAVGGLLLIVSTSTEQSSPGNQTTPPPSTH